MNFIRNIRLPSALIAWTRLSYESVRLAEPNWRKGKSVIAGVYGADSTPVSVVPGATNILVSAVPGVTRIPVFVNLPARNADQVPVWPVLNVEVIFATEPAMTTPDRPVIALTANATVILVPVARNARVPVNVAAAIITRVSAARGNNVPIAEDTWMLYTPVPARFVHLAHAPNVRSAGNANVPKFMTTVRMRSNITNSWRMKITTF